jgi:excisionase family DNA binding protein
MEREALNVKETAASLGASVASVWKWIREGELPSVKIGGRVFVPRDALRRRLESGRHQPDSPQPETCPSAGRIPRRQR